MSEESMINALRLLRASKLKNKTERLRDLYDEIEALKACGISHARIVETMRTQNLVFNSVHAFEVTFYRVKEERANAKIRTARSTSEAAATLKVTATEISTPPVQSPMEGSDIRNIDGLSRAEAESMQRMKRYPKPQSK